MSRPSLKPISGPSQITPVAQPVQTYVRPAEPVKSSLHELAEGLAALDSGLSGFLDKRRKEQDDTDKIRAEAAFNKNNSLGWGEAVRRGLVPANASPTFMRSYKEAQGNLAGIQLRDQFTKEYLSWEGRNSNDPAQFQAFLSEFVGRNAGSDDVDVLRGLNPHIQALTSEAYQTFNSESSKSIYRGSVTTRAAIIGRSMDDANEEGLLSRQGTNYEALWGNIEEYRRQAIESGIRKEDIDAQIVESIAAKAVELRDPQLLDLLDKSVDGEDISLKDVPDYRKLREDAMSRLETLARQQESDRDRAEEKRSKEEEDAITSGVMRMLAADPNGDVPEETLKRLEALNPKARTMVAEARKTLAGELEFEDPRDLLQLQREIAGGATDEDILQAVKNGRIKSGSTLSSMLDRAEKYRKARQEGTGILTSQTAKRMTKTITERAVTVKGELRAVADMFGNYSMTDEALQAIQDFETGLMQWDEQNPNATVIERERFINEMGETILRRVDDDAAVDDSNKYRGEQELLQESATQTQALPSEAQQAGGSDPTEVEKLYREDKPPMMDRLPTEYQEYIDGESKKLGISSEELNMEIWRKAKELMTGEKPEAILQKSSLGGSDIDPLGDIITAAYTAAEESPVVQSAVAPILDLLGTGEGTDGGAGYDETFGHGAYTGGPVSLTSMTLGEVKQLQREMLADPSNTRNSSAVGRYQMLSDTLAETQRKMGLDDSAVFDRDLQDAMAVELLKRRGYEKWSRGEITDEEFMDNLAKEWASLPNSSGVGHYPGQKARVGIPDVLSAFASSKEFGNSTAEMLSSYGDTVSPGVRKLPGLRWDGRKLSDVKGLTIHHTGGRGTPGGVVGVLNKRGFGAQFIMDRDGTIYQTVPEGGRVAHMKNAQNGSGLSNDNTMGIEIIANDDNDLTPAQVASAVRWIEMMRQKYPGIGDNVFGHGEVNSHKQATEGMAVINAWRQRRSV